MKARREAENGDSSFILSLSLLMKRSVHLTPRLVMVSLRVPDELGLVASRHSRIVHFKACFGGLYSIIDARQGL